MNKKQKSCSSLKKTLSKSNSVLKKHKFLISVFIFIVLLLTTLNVRNAVIALNYYNMAQVATHNTPTNCWIVIKDAGVDKVFNVSSHDRTDHMQLYIKNYCGKNATSIFSSPASHVHTLAVWTALRNVYYIGNLDMTAPVISTITATPITATGATIAWKTNEIADTQIEYGLTSAYGSSTALNPSLVTTHSQVLSGLTSSTLYHYRLKSKDALGNLAVTADRIFTTLDTTSPSVSISSPTASQSFSSSSIIVTGTASDNYALASVKVKLNAGAFALANGKAIWNNPLVLISGTNTITVRATDARGNFKDASVVVTYTPVDVTPPVISLISSSLITATGATIAWKTNEIADTQIEYGLTSAYGSSTALNPSLVTTHSQVLSGLTNYTSYHYRVKSKDKAGNISVSTDKFFTTLDTTVPAISIISPTASQSFSSSSIIVTGTASDNYALASVKVKLNAGAFALANGTAIWNKPLVLVSGTNTITVRATDARGNFKDASVVVTYTPS